MKKTATEKLQDLENKHFPKKKHYYKTREDALKDCNPSMPQESKDRLTDARMAAQGIADRIRKEGIKSD